MQDSQEWFALFGQTEGVASAVSIVEVQKRSAALQGRGGERMRSNWAWIEQQEWLVVGPCWALD